jgi:transposase-like protein
MSYEIAHEAVHPVEGEDPHREELDPSQNRTLTPRQEIVLTALVGGSTVTAAAEAVGVRRETVSRWVNGDPAFRAALEARRRELLEASRRTLAASALAACDVLAELLRAEDARIRLGAAKAILSLCWVGSGSSRSGSTAARPRRPR